MLPPVTTISTSFSGKTPGCREHRRDPRGARALDDELLAFEQGFDRVFEHRLVDQQNVRDQSFDDAPGQPARLLDCDPFRQSHRLGWGTRVLAAHQPAHRRVEHRLHPDDLDARNESLGRHRGPRNEPAAADRHDDRVEIGPVGQQLERDSPLPGDDRRVVIGVDKGQALFARERLCRFARGGKAVASEHDLGAERFGVIDFDERRALGHDDRRRDAETPRMVGDTLGMVAGRHRDDAGAALAGGQGQKLVQGAAFLERAGAMQGLQLQPDLGPGELGQCRGGDGRRVRHRPRDCHGGVADVVDRYRQIIHIGGPELDLGGSGIRGFLPAPHF